MQPAYKKSSKLKLAKTQDIERFDYFTLHGGYEGGPEGLSDKARTIYRYFCAFAKNDYFGVSSFTDEVITGINRASNIRFAKRTFERKIAELETFGLIRRQKFKVGKDRKKLIIHFTDQLIDRAKPKVASIHPTRTHMITPPPNWRSDNWTNSQGNVKPRNSSVLLDTKPRAGVIDINRANKNKKHRENPVFYSVRKVLESSKWQSERKFLLAQAKEELAKPSDEWRDWERKWMSALIPERENIVTEQIIPYLKMRCEQIEDNLIELPIETIPEQPEPDPITPEELAELKRKYGFADDIKEPTKSISASIADNMSQEELEILLDANERAVLRREQLKT